MKRNIISILAFTFILSIMTGCSNSSKEISKDSVQEETVNGDNKNKNEDTLITIWTNNRHDEAYVRQELENFGEANPNIDVELTIQTDNLNSVLMLAYNSHQAPDMYNMSAISLEAQQYYDAGLSLPLNNYITDEFASRLELDRATWDNINVFDGNITYIPTAQRSGFRLIYNQEMYDAAGLTEPPKTMKDFITMSDQLTNEAEGKYGTAFPGNSSPFERFFQPVAEMSGILPYDFAKGRYDFAKFEPIIEYGRQLFADGSVIPGATSLAIDPQRVQFAEGKIGMYGNASQEVGVLTEQFPTQMEWHAAQLPTLDGEIKGTLFSLPKNGWSITSTSPNPDKAWEVVEFLSSDDFLIGYGEGGYDFVFSNSIREKVDESKTGKLAEFAIQDFEGLYPPFPPVAPEGDDWRTTLWNLCQPDSGDIKSALNALTEKYNLALDNEISIGRLKRTVIEDFDIKNPMDGTVQYLDK
ncbi:MAG: ABC transporter substrate-binding protein [Lachnospirales bacterium]